MSKKITKVLPVKKNGKNGNAVLGPVDNLEMHLRPDWWRRIFNSMYLKTDADVVEDKQITRNEVELFTSILMVPTCGIISSQEAGNGSIKNILFAANAP